MTIIRSSSGLKRWDISLLFVENKSSKCDGYCFAKKVGEKKYNEDEKDDKLKAEKIRK